jgi:hypothetical protein
MEFPACPSQEFRGPLDIESCFAVRCFEISERRGSAVCVPVSDLFRTRPHRLRCHSPDRLDRFQSSFQAPRFSGAAMNIAPSGLTRGPLI